MSSLMTRKKSDVGRILNKAVFSKVAFFYFGKINVYSFLHLFSVQEYMYVPKCTHTIVHMWPEDNVQDTILVFHVGLQVVVCDVSFTLRAILLDLTRYSLKRQGEDEAELSTWL